MANKVNIELLPDEVRVIAVLRAINEVDQHHLIGPEDVGGALSLLKTVAPIGDFETTLSGDELRLLLKGYIYGLAASESRNYPVNYQETEYTGGPTGGVAELQGKDPRYITNTGPQE